MKNQETENSDLSIKDHIAIEAMKILLNNDHALSHFSVQIKNAENQRDKQKLNAEMLADACYAIAFAMRKARLGSFE